MHQRFSKEDLLTQCRARSREWCSENGSPEEGLLLPRHQGLDAKRSGGFDTSEPAIHRIERMSCSRKVEAKLRKWRTSCERIVDTDPA
jgi:hypothetical protein